MKKLLLHSIFVSFIWLVNAISNLANAGLIDTNSTLLNDANATQLEQWLGQGDLDWQSVWYGTSNARSHAWHRAVDDVGPTVSIYNITYGGNSYLVGGYTNLSWRKTGDGLKKGIGESFIFNFAKAKRWGVSAGNVEIVTDPYHFATFGAGHDLIGGFTGIGISKGSNKIGSYNYSDRWDSIVGFSSSRNYFKVNSLETFTFSPATQVPEPPTLAVIALGIFGIVSRRNKKQIPLKNSN